MKRTLIVLFLACWTISAQAGQNPDASRPTKPLTEKKNTNSTVWLGAGVVFLVVLIATAKRRRTNK
jgi:hypothetical protein